MNILYTTFSFSIGGIERLLVDIVNEASKNKDNKIFLCIINEHYDEFLLNTISKRVNVILLNRYAGSGKLKYIFRYTKFILKNKIYIIHCQTENAVKFSALSKIIRPKIKVFTTVHDTCYSDLKLYEIIIDKIVCNKIIAISEAVKEQIIARGISKEKIAKINNGINLDKFQEAKDRVYESKKEIIIGNVSRLLPEEKGQDILIKAISLLKKKYPNIKCLFAGEAAPNSPLILDELKQLCEELEVGDNIIFCGNVKEVSEFLNSLDIFVLPSRYEGFGIALVEAMYKGIPCIASNIDGPKEIIKDNKYGLLFESNNYEDLAEKIDYRINNMKIRSKEIKAYVEDNFNIVNMVKKLLQLYGL